MKVCKNCKHKKESHFPCFGCMAIVEDDGRGKFFGVVDKWYCDCAGWNSKNRTVRVLIPR